MQIRYTQGPDTLTFGDYTLQRGQWQDLPDDLAREATYPQRVAEYGFESRTPKTPKQEQ